MRVGHLELLRAGTPEATQELRRRGLRRGVTERQWRGDYCEALVALHVDGVLAPVNNPAFDVSSDTLGRIEVKSRSRASRHLNWYHLRGLERRGFDHFVAVELNDDWTVADAWMLTYDEVLEHRHRRRDGRNVEPTKLSVRGHWKRVAHRLDLASTQATID